MPFQLAKKEFIQSLEMLYPGGHFSGSELTNPPNSAMGDFSLPTFALAKFLKKSPGEVAMEIVSRIKPRGLIHALEAAGPYVNVHLERNKLANAVFAEMKKKKYGFKKAKKSKKILLEFVSPNTNKPLHLGHLRNAFLGTATSNLLEAGGEKVTKSILYNDRGIHIMKSMLAYLKFGADMDPKKEKIKGDHFVGKYYVLFENAVKSDSALEDEAKDALVRWEKGDKGLLKLWKKMNSWAEGGFEETLKRIGVEFEEFKKESALYKKGKKIVFDAFKKGIFSKDENGNIIAPLEKWNLPNKVMLRSDGTSVYATTDLALAVERFKKHRFDRLIYVVGMEQDLHFRQLFKIFELLKFPFASRVEHLSYNWVFLPEGRMKSREGKVVEADALLDGLHELAANEIKSRNDQLKDKETDKRAEIISQAALKFYLLQVDPKSDIHFNPSAALALSGRTGPYIQYSYARITSLLRKAGKSARGSSQKENITIGDIEHKIMVLLSRYGETINESGISRNPAILAKFLFELAQSFSDFYEKDPILKASKGHRQFRLALCRSVLGVIESGLGILGIKALAEM